MLDDNRDAIVYIHGFANDFSSSVARAAQLSDVYRITRPGGEVYQPHVFAFSWPSNGKVVPPWQYFSDRDDAEASGKAMARATIRLVDFLNQSRAEGLRCDHRLHLVAHSMGNYVLRGAVQEISRQHPGRPPRVFDQVFLMAADEDDNAFQHEHKLLPLPRLAKRVNVYFNNEDLAMSVSDKTKGQPDRLGADGPRLPRSVPGKVTLIDCTPVVSGVVEHSYYLDSDRVAEDMRWVLTGLPSDEIGGRDYIIETNRYRLTK